MFTIVEADTSGAFIFELSFVVYMPNACMLISTFYLLLLWYSCYLLNCTNLHSKCRGTGNLVFYFVGLKHSDPTIVSALTIHFQHSLASLLSCHFQVVYYLSVCVFWKFNFGFLSSNSYELKVFKLMIL